MVSRWMSDVHVSIRPSVSHTSVRDNLSKHQWIFFKVGMCIDIVEIWFGISNEQISSIFMELSARDTPIFSFPDDNKYMSVDFHQTWYVHRYCGDLVSDC